MIPATKKCKGIKIFFMLCLIMLLSNQAFALDLDNPKRTGLYLGLEPGFVLPQIHLGDALPKYLRLNLRMGWCVFEWMHTGIDFTMDVVADTAGLSGHSAPKLLQPTLTFFPIYGLNFRFGGGFDPSHQHRYSLSAGLGYEFPIDNKGGFGIGFMFSQLWHTDGTPDWQLYGIVMQFTGYGVEKWWNDMMDID